MTRKDLPPVTRQDVIASWRATHNSTAGAALLHITKTHYRRLLVKFKIRRRKVSGASEKETRQRIAKAARYHIEKIDAHIVGRIGKRPIYELRIIANRRLTEADWEQILATKLPPPGEW